MPVPKIILAATPAAHIMAGQRLTRDRTEFTRDLRRRGLGPTKKIGLAGIRVGKLRILNAAGSFLPVGHKAGTPVPPAGFGAPRFTEAEQAANPDKPMTRLVKDVLRAPEKLAVDVDPRTGEPVFWDVQVGTLRRLSGAFRLAASRGVAFNLTKSHGDLQTGIVPTDELIAPLDDCLEENGVLWVSTYVTPAQATYLQNPSCKVSVGVWDDWTDGLGNKYKSALIHVAVTDHPVLPGQGPFLKLANEQRGTAMDVVALIELINKMLPGELSLPEDTAEENLVERLGLVLTVLAGGTGEAPAADGADDAAAAEAAAAEAANAQATGTPTALNLAGIKDPALAAVLGTIASGFKVLTNQVAGLTKEKTESAKAAYLGRVKALCLAGLAAAEGVRLTNLGARHGYDLDLLAGAEALPTLRKPVGRTLATSQGPGMATTGESAAPATDDEIKKRLQARGVDPTKFYPRIAQR
jgi:hypothetical protein